MGLKLVLVLKMVDIKFSNLFRVTGMRARGDGRRWNFRAQRRTELATIR